MARNANKQPESASVQLLEKELKKLDTSKKAYYTEVEKVRNEISLLKEESARIEAQNNDEVSKAKKLLKELSDQQNVFRKALVAKQVEAKKVLTEIENQILARQKERDAIITSFKVEKEDILTAQRKLDTTLLEVKEQRQKLDNESASLAIKRSEIESLERAGIEKRSAIKREEERLAKQKADILDRHNRILDERVKVENRIQQADKAETEAEKSIAHLDAKRKEYAGLEKEKAELAKEKEKLGKKTLDLSNWSASLTEKEEMLNIREAGLFQKEKKLNLTKKYIKEAQDGTN